MRSYDLRNELAKICDLFRTDATPVSELAVMRLERLMDAMPAVSRPDLNEERLGSPLRSALLPLIQEAIRDNGTLRRYHSGSEGVSMFTAVGEVVLQKWGSSSTDFSLSEFRKLTRQIIGREGLVVSRISLALRKAGLIEYVVENQSGGGFRTTERARSLMELVQQENGGDL